MRLFIKAASLTFPHIILKYHFIQYKVLFLVVFLPTVNTVFQTGLTPSHVCHYHASFTSMCLNRG